MNRTGLRILRWAFSAKQWFLFRLTRAGRLVAAGIVVSAVFGVDTHANLSHQIFCFLVALAGVALLAGRGGDIPVSLTRRLPRHATVGRPFSYRLQVSGDNPAPLSDLVFREVVDTEGVFGKPAAADGGVRFSWVGYWRARNRLLPRSPLGRAVLRRLGVRDRRDLTITLEPRARGRLDFEGVAVSRPEPLGLYRRQSVKPLRDSVLVLPKRFRLPPVVLPGRRHHQPGGVSMAASVGDSEEFVALRDYRPGDPLRRIHWKSWAKTGRPVVKEYQEEFFVRHALVLDTFSDGADPGVFEDAVSLAASFVSDASPETLLDLMFVGAEAYCFTSGRGLAHTEKMLEILSGVSTCSGRTFDALLPVVLRRAALLSACICVLLSWDRHRRRLVAMLRRLNVPAEVFVLTAGEDSPQTDPGPMRDRPHRFHVLTAGSVQQQLDQR